MHSNGVVVPQAGSCSVLAAGRCSSNPMKVVSMKPRVSVRRTLAQPCAAAAGNGSAAEPAVHTNGAAAAAAAAASAALNTSSNGHGAAAASLDAPSVSAVYRRIQECAAYIRSRTSLQPQVVMVLGSGLGPIADEVQDATVIAYADIPHFHAPGVQGHPGRLLIGRFAGVPVMVMQGRFHYYEGHPMEEVVLPVRVAGALGCHSAILTNAAGGINHGFHLGDLMLLTDHLNLMAANPLRGPNPPELGGPRFLDLSQPYDAGLLGILQQQGQALGIADSLRTGTYAAVSGPTYETPAETRMLRAVGADAVGMSTVPEVIAARHLGLRVAGISCITNLACGISHDGQVAKVTHEEVMTNISLGMEKMKALLLAAVPLMQQEQAAGAAPAGAAAAAQ